MVNVHRVGLALLIAGFGVLGLGIVMNLLTGWNSDLTALLGLVLVIGGVLVQRRAWGQDRYLIRRPDPKRPDDSA